MKEEKKLLNVKGSYDYLPKDQKIRNYIQDVLKEIFELFGYNPIETPILCYYNLLALKYDEDSEILKEIYKLSDQGKRDLGLRYDLTVPFSKYIVLNKEIKLPFKKYEIGKVFRDGPVKKGRDREFIQCDVDVVGIKGQMIEAELISLVAEAFKRFEIDIEIKYNNRNLLMGLIEEIGVSDKKVLDVITIIDKSEKLTTLELKEQLSLLKIDDCKINELLNNLQLKFTDLEKKYKSTNNISLKQGIEEISNLNKFLEKMGLLSCTKFTPSLARGHEYYTGFVIEVFEKNGYITSSISGGGRYDKMIGDFINDGNEYPAVGLSFGLSSIYEILKDRQKFSSDNMLDIYIIPIETEEQSLNLANSIRNLGYKVDLEMTNRKVKKALDFANKEGIPYVIVLGEDEIQNGNFKLKNMKNNVEYLIDINNLKEIKNII